MLVALSDVVSDAAAAVLRASLVKGGEVSALVALAASKVVAA